VILSQHVGPVGYRNIVLKLLERGAYATLGRAVLVRATHLVYATPAAETFVPALLGYRPPRACSIPNGIDFSLFDPPSRARRMAARTRLGLPLDARIVLFAGRLVEKKGLPIVLEVSRRSPGVHFLVIGDGPLSTLLEGLGPHVTWLPTVEHARMADYYHGADCLLLPSRGEGLPLVVQEAMACGLPLVVTADEAYARELAAAEACVAVAPSADQVTAAMNRVLVDTPADLAERQRRYAESRWEVTDMVRRYVALIQEVGRHLHRVPS
jgi:glycosyltransferase involved in cell wall biosynthesis